MTDPDDKRDATPPKMPSDRKPKKARPPGGPNPRSSARKRDVEPPPASPPKDTPNPARRGFGIRSEGGPQPSRSDRPRPGPGRSRSGPGGGGRSRPADGDSPPWRQALGGDRRRGESDGPRNPRPGGFRPGGGPRRDADRPPDRRLPDDRAELGGRFRHRPGPPGKSHGQDRQPFQGGRPNWPSFDRPNWPPYDRQDRPPSGRAGGPRPAGPRPVGPRPPFAGPRPPYAGPRSGPAPRPRPPWVGPPGRPGDAPQFRDRRPPPQPTNDLLDQGEELVAGRRPVEEAFVARRPALRLLVVPQRRQALERLVLHATSLRIPIIEVEGGTLTAVAGFDGHQGIALVVGPRRFASLDEILARSIERAEPPFVLALDSLEDPQNVGTLLRSAEAAGVHGVIFPTHRQAPLSPSAVKASAGAVEHLLLCPVDDLPGALSDLRIRGLRVVGAEAGAPLTARQSDLRGPLAIVVGSEGQGLSPPVRRRCDFVIRIPMRGAIGSLNAAVAGSIMLFEAVAQRDPDDKGAEPRPAETAEPAGGDDEWARLSLRPSRLRVTKPRRRTRQRTSRPGTCSRADRRPTDRGYEARRSSHALLRRTIGAGSEWRPMAGPDRRRRSHPRSTETAAPTSSAVPPPNVAADLPAHRALDFVADLAPEPVIRRRVADSSLDEGRVRCGRQATPLLPGARSLSVRCGRAGGRSHRSPGAQIGPGAGPKSAAGGRRRRRDGHQVAARAGVTPARAIAASRRDPVALADRRQAVRPLRGPPGLRASARRPERRVRGGPSSGATRPDLGTHRLGDGRPEELPPPNSHERALSWFNPISPTRVEVGNPGPRKRLIYVFENLG